MGKRCLADSGNIFQEQVPASQQADDGHFDHMALSLDDAGNIVLDRLDGSRCVHVGIIAAGGSEMGGDLTLLESNKGSGGGQFIRGFPRRAPFAVDWNERSGLLPLRDEYDHPGRRFFNHVTEAPGGVAGRHIRKRGAAADGDGKEAVVRIVGSIRRQYARNPFA